MPPSVNAVVTPSVPVGRSPRRYGGAYVVKAAETVTCRPFCGTVAPKPVRRIEPGRAARRNPVP